MLKIRSPTDKIPSRATRPFGMMACTSSPASLKRKKALQSDFRKDPTKSVEDYQVQFPYRNRLQIVNFIIPGHC